MIFISISIQINKNGLPKAGSMKNLLSKVKMPGSKSKQKNKNGNDTASNSETSTKDDTNDSASSSVKPDLPATDVGAQQEEKVFPGEPAAVDQTAKENGSPENNINAEANTHQSLLEPNEDGDKGCDNAAVVPSSKPDEPIAQEKSSKVCSDKDTDKTTDSISEEPVAQEESSKISSDKVSDQNTDNVSEILSTNAADNEIR